MKGKKSSSKKGQRRAADPEKAKPVSVWTKKDQEMAEENRKDEGLELETDRDSK